MARPRTLGPTVTFRLPIDLHAVAEERARARGQTVNAYLATRITEALARIGDGEQRAAAPHPPPGPQPAPRKVTPQWKASMKQ